MSEEIKKKKTDAVWFEKYRPRTLEDACYPARIKDKFKNGLYGNLILAGIHGSGKTTLARILRQNHSVLYIDGSLDNGVETVRNQILQFCSVSNFDNKMKVVHIDEFDLFSFAGQGGLRGTIEKFIATTRFIFTCNFPDKIIEPIHSRCEVIKFPFQGDEEKEQQNLYIKRIVEIAQKENMTFDKDGILELMKRHYPDFRTIINQMQGVKRTGGNIDLQSLKAASMGEVDEEFYNMLIKTSMPEDIFKYVQAKFQNKERVAYDALGSSFLQWLMSPEVGKANKVGHAAAVIHKYQYEQQGVIDKLVSLVACCHELHLVTR